MEKISVIIPTYNRADVLERAVRSVLQQTYDNLEVIIVDDCSTDNTEQVVCQMKDERIRYVKQISNGGPSVARNTGVAHATAEIIAFQDSDDYWHPDKLEKQMCYWDEHSDYGMIYSYYMLHRVNGEAVAVPYEETWGELEGDIFRTLLLNNTVGTPTMLMRKACFEQINGFDAELGCLEDWDFALRFAEHYKIGLVQDILVDAYQSFGGVSSNVSSFYNTRCKMIVRYKEQLLARGMFDMAVGDLFVRAQNAGMLEPVKKMLMVYLQRSM